MLADDITGSDCHKTWNFNEWVIHSVIVQIKALSQVDIPVLHIRLWTALTIKQILLTKQQQKHNSNYLKVVLSEDWQKLDDMCKLQIKAPLPEYKHFA